MVAGLASGLVDRVSGACLRSLVLLDLWIYWWHRANHRVPFLWRFHEVHHLDQFLDMTTALRFHLGEVLLSAIVRGVIIVILAVPLMSVVIFETALLLATMFHHSNMKLPQVSSGPCLARGDSFHPLGASSCLAPRYGFQLLDGAFDLGQAICQPQPNQADARSRDWSGSGNMKSHFWRCFVSPSESE